MKKLSIEEKAKAYDKALERAKECHIDGLSLHQPVKDIIEYIFPELKESEDEKIRKTLIEYFNAYPKDYYGELKKSHILAWLEKQGGQKPAWSALDERNLEGIIDEIEASKNFAPESDLVTYDRYLSWLKLLRTKNTWKPSEEQINTLFKYAEQNNKDGNILTSLYQDLKKLTE